MSDSERALRSNCPITCPCLCHDGFGGAHHGQKCADAQDEWHFAYLGMEYRHFGRKEDCDRCLNWKLPTEPPLDPPRLIPSWVFTVPTEDPTEPRYMETLDADERGGH